MEEADLGDRSAVILHTTHREGGSAGREKHWKTIFDVIIFGHRAQPVRFASIVLDARVYSSGLAQLFLLSMFIF
jgi:hypothetical protein